MALYDKMKDMDSMILLNIIVGIVMAVGVVGAVIQVIPSAPLIGLAVLVWAIVQNTSTAWGFFAGIVAILVISTVLKYVVPGKKLAASGVPKSTLIIAGLVGVAGWFLIPVAGLVAFPLTIYLCERHRLGTHTHAVDSTITTMKAIGMSIVVEVIAALIAVTLWVVALFIV